MSNNSSSSTTEAYQALRKREEECERIYKQTKATSATLSPETSLMLTEAIAYLERTWQTAKSAREAEGKRWREIARKKKQQMNLEDFMFQQWLGTVTEDGEEEALKHNPDCSYHQIASRTTPITEVHTWVVHALLDMDCYWQSDGDSDEREVGCHIMANSINLKSLHSKIADSYARMLFMDKY